MRTNDLRRNPSAAGKPRDANSVRRTQAAPKRKKRVQHTSRRRRGPQRPWRLALALLLGAGLLVSCAMLASQAIEDRRIESIMRRNRELASGGGTDLAVRTASPDPNAYGDAAEVTPAPQAPTPSPTLIPDSTVTAAAAPTTSGGAVDLLALQRLNIDTVGWLSMDSVASINFAVVQGRNAYYLNHDFDRHANSYGTPFLDEGSPLASQPDNLIIYAHNMRNGEMFGELNRVLENGRLIDYPFVHFSTIYGDQDFIPYAVVDLSVNPKSRKFLQYYIPNFTGPGQFIDYVFQAEHVSRVTLPWHAEYGDQLMTLVTCGKKADERLVVFLRSVRDSERSAS